VTPFIEFLQSMFLAILTLLVWSLQTRLNETQKKVSALEEQKRSLEARFRTSLEIVNRHEYLLYANRVTEQINSDPNGPVL
jgi:hypothetical protein